MLMRCPAAASRRQGCDLEPQLETLLTSDDVDEELEMNWASVVTDTTHLRLSCTAKGKTLTLCSWLYWWTFYIYASPLCIYLCICTLNSDEKELMQLSVKRLTVLTFQSFALQWRRQNGFKGLILTLRIKSSRTKIIAQFTKTLVCVFLLFHFQRIKFCVRFVPWNVLHLTSKCTEMRWAAAGSARTRWWSLQSSPNLLAGLKRKDMEEGGMGKEWEVRKREIKWKREMEVWTPTPIRKSCARY